MSIEFLSVWFFYCFIICTAGRQGWTAEIVLSTFHPGTGERQTINASGILWWEIGEEHHCILWLLLEWRPALAAGCLYRWTWRNEGDVYYKHWDTQQVRIVYLLFSCTYLGKQGYLHFWSSHKNFHYSTYFSGSSFFIFVVFNISWHMYSMACIKF